MADKITIGATFSELNKYNNELNMQIVEAQDIYFGMVQNIEEVDDMKRVILPESRDFTFDATKNPLPEAALKYKKETNSAKKKKVIIHTMYQHLLLAALKSDPDFTEMLQVGAFVAYGGIYSAIANCIYHPGPEKKEEDGEEEKNHNADLNSGNFTMTAVNVNNIIFLNWTTKQERQSGSDNNEVSEPEPKRNKTSEEAKSYRLVLSSLKFEKKSKNCLPMITVAETDGYEEITPGTFITVEDKKVTKKKQDEFWTSKTNEEGKNDQYGITKRRLQDYVKMEICSTGFIRYKFLKEDEEDKKNELVERDALLKRVMEKATDAKQKKIWEKVLKCMKSFLAKVLMTVQKMLDNKNRHYCVIEFVREKVDRKTKGSGSFVIEYKGIIGDDDLLSHFKTAFPL